jgi:asparagine synthase (glutamine-hydrolysing)
MCGITGLFNRDGAPVDEELLVRMTRAIAHRGPDGQGLLVRGAVGLGHRRLSIIDIDGGAQPIGNEDGSIQVIFNGEIYNFVELRRELQSAGHVFRTRSDTEVLVHAYEQWGGAFVSKLNGMFAFALLDSRTRTLWLARDPLGIKPLYYTEVGSQWLFASEIKALLQHPGVPREFDPLALADLFTFRYVPSPQCLMSGVRKLPPGHIARVDNASVQISRYWAPAPSLRRGEREEPLIEEYRDLLSDTLRMQMRSDVPVGLLLSSGVDSGALLSLMSQHTGQPVEAFTVDFENGQDSNESTDAAATARRYGANHHTLCVTAQDYRAYFERYMQDLEEPVGHEAAPAFYFVSRLASERVKVALTGQGADEPWAGYGRYIGVRLSNMYSRLPAPLTSGVARIVSALPLPSERLQRGVTALGERDVLSRFVKVYSFFSAEMKHDLYCNRLKAQLADAARVPADAIRALQQEVSHLDPLTQMLYLDTRTSLPDDLLMVGDKTSMANSLELRVPFLDHRLVEFVESLPPELKLRGWTGKYLHKKALLKWLPRTEVYRAKKGFANPIATWLRTSMRGFVDECLLSRDAAVAQYFNQGFIRRLLDADRQGRAVFTRHIYLLLSLELWHRKFLRSA